MVYFNGVHLSTKTQTPPPIVVPVLSLSVVDLLSEPPSPICSARSIESLDSACDSPLAFDYWPSGVILPATPAQLFHGPGLGMNTTGNAMNSTFADLGLNDSAFSESPSSEDEGEAMFEDR